MLVAILHNAVADDAPADERDVLVQAEAVAGALARLGHEPVAVPVTLDLDVTLRRPLVAMKPDVAFNLVEALGGTDRLSPAVPVLLETLGIPYTGNDADALHVTNSKRLTKELFRHAYSLEPSPAGLHGILTPASVYVSGTRVEPIGYVSGAAMPGPFLVKAVHEHASFGMEDDAVIEADSMDDVVAAVRRRIDRFGKPFFAEAFIDGREFNLSVLGRGDGTPEVLPPAEISFDSFPDGKPRIVGYAAKWDSDSFEYNETPRRFDFPPEDAALLEELRFHAELAWKVLCLSGYARVDFRVDSAGRPWVIEANANPCLSPDAGFAAAIDRAGFGFDEAVRRIVAAAFS